MVDRNKELAKNTVILGIGQLVPKLIGLIVLPIITTYLSTQDYGLYDLIVSCSSLITPIVTLQIQQAIFRYLLMTKKEEDKTEYISSALLFLIISSLAGSLVVFFVLKIILKTTIILTILITLLYLFEATYLLLGQIVRGLGHNTKYSISVIVYSITNMALLVLLVAKANFALYGVTISLVAAYICSDVYMLFASGVLPYLNVRSFSKSKLFELLHFSLPIVPSSIALWVVNLSDRLIIIHFLGSSSNGIYAVANKIPGIYNTAYNIFSLAWVETAAKVSDDGKPDEYYSIMFSKLYNFLIGVMLFMLAFTPLIFKLLVRGDFTQAIQQVPILYFGVFFNSLLNYYSGIYIALKRTKQVGISSALGAIINAAINILFVRRWGLYAASISTAIAFCIIVIYRAYDLRKVINIIYNKNDIVIGFILFIICSIMIILSNTFLSLLCLAIAVLYNYVKNKEFGKTVVRKIIRKGD